MMYIRIFFPAIKGIQDIVSEMIRACEVSYDWIGAQRVKINS